MKSISFAWTTPALLAGAKTCTRRDWKPRWAASFREGELVAAWNRDRRVHGAHQVGVIRLTQHPSYEPLAYMPDSDYVAEGFAWFMENPEELPARRGPMGVSWTAFEAWRQSNSSLWVVRFELVKVL